MGEQPSELIEDVEVAEVLPMADSVAWDRTEYDGEPSDVPFIDQIDEASKNNGIEPSLAVGKRVGAVSLSETPFWTRVEG